MPPLLVILHVLNYHALLSTPLVAENADIIAIQETKLSAKGPTKKHLQILEDYFPDYDNTWRSSVEPARKGYAGTMFLYKKELNPVITYPEIEHRQPWTVKDASSLLNLTISL